MVTPEVHVADGTWEATGGSTAGPTKGRYTVVRKKTDGRWQIVWLQTFVPQTSARGPVTATAAVPIRVYPIWHMPQTADTAVFAVSKGLVHRETLFGTGAERLTPVFCSIATHTPSIGSWSAVGADDASPGDAADPPSPQRLG